MMHEPRQETYVNGGTLVLCVFEFLMTVTVSNDMTRPWPCQLKYFMVQENYDTNYEISFNLRFHLTHILVHNYAISHSSHIGKKKACTKHVPFYRYNFLNI